MKISENREYELIVDRQNGDRYRYKAIMKNVYAFYNASLRALFLEFF